MGCHAVMRSPPGVSGRQGGQTARSRPKDTSRYLPFPNGQGLQIPLAALAVGTTAWSLTLALSQTCPASTVSGAVTPQMETASTSARTPASIVQIPAVRGKAGKLLVAWGFG